MKKKANIYDADDVERSKRLNFTPEERAARAEHKAEVLGTKLEKAKKKVPKKKKLRLQKELDPEKSKLKNTLRFEEVEKKRGQEALPKKAGRRMVQSASATVHSKIHQVEEENVGTKAAHRTELASEGAAALASHEIRKYRQNAPYKRVEKLEAQVNRANVSAAYRAAVRDKLNGGSDAQIAQLQTRLNSAYDSFTAKWGLLNSTGNKRAFEQDSSYCLLCSLEVLDEDRNLERKADMFSKRTINQEKRIDHVDTPVEALAVSIGERAGVDLSFMAEILDRPGGKTRDSANNTLAYVTYGTKRKNAYAIIEDSLNLRDCRVYDTIHDADGTEKRVLNTKETMLAQQKQEMVREAFKSWIWKDPERREALCQKYNEIFNSIKPREYDGSHIRFTGMTPENDC